METLSITHHQVVTSTSDLAAEAARAGAREGTAFRGDVQTEGRGRHGRRWISPEGNLYLSVVLRPGRARAEWPSLSLVAAIALHDAISSFRGRDRVGLKWPNDVLLDDRKCAGLLLEVVDQAVILGCGVNCNAPPDDVPGWQPGSLNQRAGDAVVSPDDLLGVLEESLPARYGDWRSGGFAGLRDDWMAASAHIGKEISLEMEGGRVRTGLFEDVGADGALCLRCDDRATGGAVRLEIQAGDVLQTRPDGEIRDGAGNATGH